MAVSKLLARFSTDTDAEEMGRWVDFGDGIRIRIRRIRSQKSIEVRKELDKPYANDLRRGALADSVAEDLLIKQVAAGVISAWEGIDIGDGDLPYTPDNAYKVLKLLPDLRDEILQVSMSAESFRKHFDDGVVENLSAS